MTEIDWPMVAAIYRAGIATGNATFATTGFRPDLSILGELRLALDPSVESPTALAPLIDPQRA